MVRRAKTLHLHPNSHFPDSWDCNRKQATCNRRLTKASFLLQSSTLGPIV